MEYRAGGQEHVAQPSSLEVIPKSLDQIEARRGRGIRRIEKDVPEGDSSLAQWVSHGPVSARQRDIFREVVGELLADEMKLKLEPREIRRCYRRDHQALERGVELIVTARRPRTRGRFCAGLIRRRVSLTRYWVAFNQPSPQYHLESEWGHG